jgi:uncharacterized membrane protein YdjX (TVP38/TMEM64 family)
MRIHLTEKLAFKILSIGLAILVFGIIATSTTVFYIVKANIYSVASHRLEATSKVIKESLERIMLEGRAETSRALAENL